MSGAPTLSVPCGDGVFLMFRGTHQTGAYREPGVGGMCSVRQLAAKYVPLKCHDGLEICYLATSCRLAQELLLVRCIWSEPGSFGWAQHRRPTVVVITYSAARWQQGVPPEARLCRSSCSLFYGAVPTARSLRMADMASCFDCVS